MVRNFTSATSAVCSSLSALLTHLGTLSSFDSQRLTEDSATALLWKNASSPFRAYTDVLIELLSLSLLIAGIITGTLEWAVPAEHLLSVVTLKVTGPRSVVYGRANIEVVIRPAALVRLF